MANQPNSAPENHFGITDARELDEIAGELTALRLFELEYGKPLTTFTREDLCWVHRYLLQDVFPWAGHIRTEEVSAMGMPMCRTRFVNRELDRVIRDIDASASAPQSDTHTLKIRLQQQTQSPRSLTTGASSHSSILSVMATRGPNASSSTSSYVHWVGVSIGPLSTPMKSTPLATSAQLRQTLLFLPRSCCPA